MLFFVWFDCVDLICFHSSECELELSCEMPELNVIKVNVECWSDNIQLTLSMSC